jgi:hypothetical protein
VFTVNDEGFNFDDKREKGKGPVGLAALEEARGATKPPNVQVGFGRCE